ncbi:hypothetical protein AFV1_ORF307 [Captovirus AFV1]|uniref:Uncharacterized protein ORF307 n=1 Tax=Acidianus filamentous virus 1 (isolate United States/Yellowstone) TaxID=654909 RepID=Y307_AFV1Y|nr:hypothetical protein AFV1_ORF307 [Captovirus AFV1]Q70LC0.1 RecName: Full=Uncharacterized protein ORF307 [Acidianus filamentous virus 1 (isolate Yellowstone)]CAD98960.1 hypothetical protein [Captovirus AFV1]
MTRRYRSNPAVIPVPFPVPLPITEQTTPQIPPPSPTAIQFTCFGIPIYQSPSVPKSYAVVNVVSHNVFYGCSGDTCFEGVEGVDIRSFVFLPINLFAYIFACEAPLETQETQGTQTIIVITESKPLYNTDKVTQVNQIVQGQFTDKSEVLSINYGDVNVTDINYLSFIQTGLQIATKFTLPLCDRISIFKTPFELAVAKTLYLEIVGKERPELTAILDFMQSLDAEISGIIETDYQEIEPNGKLTDVISKPIQNQLPLQILPGLILGESYQFNTNNILMQTEIETEIGEQLYTDGITFETELTVKQS